MYTGSVPDSIQGEVPGKNPEFQQFERGHHGTDPAGTVQSVNTCKCIASGFPLRYVGGHMKNFSAEISSEVGQWLEKTFAPQDPVLSEIRERSKASGLPQIHVGPMDGLHLEVLTRISGAKKAVEIGTLAGYSGVCICRGMGPSGLLYTFDADRKHMDVAQESFRRAGVGSQVKGFIGPAIKNLPQIVSEGPFDLIFIDADKVGYPDYLHWAGENLRIGGLLIGDNTLAFGMLADEKFDHSDDEQTARALQRFNREAAQGGRFKATMIPTGEGLTVAVKIK
jgi:caffeoyl-CoA O-methyltransferase